MDYWLLLVGVVVGFLVCKFLESKQMNLSIKKDSPKVVDFIETRAIEEADGGKLVMCRCWKSKSFPFCVSSRHCFRAPGCTAARTYSRCCCCCCAAAARCGACFSPVAHAPRARCCPCRMGRTRRTMLPRAITWDHSSSRSRRNGDGIAAVRTNMSVRIAALLRAGHVCTASNTMSLYARIMR